MSELDLSDLDGFVQDTEEGPSDPRYYEKSLKIIKDSMGSVKQEILLTLPDGSSHIVYVMKVDISPKGQVSVDFGTPSEERKAELAEHVEKCVTMQINEALKEINMKKRWWKW